MKISLSANIFTRQPGGACGVGLRPLLSSAAQGGWVLYLRLCQHHFGLPEKPWGKVGPFVDRYSPFVFTVDWSEVMESHFEGT